jgi:hypothetical protein
MKKVLLFLLSLVLVASVVEAKIVKDSLYEIPKTAVVPLIDGQQDAVWKTLDWNMQRIYNVGDPPTATTAADSGVGLTGMSKAMWDANNLYLLFYSVDDILIDVPTNASWNQDAIEIYIDGDNSKIPDGVAPDPGGGLAPGDYQFTIPHWMIGTEVGRLGQAFGTTLDSTGVEFKIRDVPDTEGFPGWMLEVKIPLTALGIDGASAADQLIGWELQQDESDDATLGRTSMSKWWCNSNNSWTNAALWGTAILTQRNHPIDTVLEIKKTSAAITIDGTMDAAYKLANPTTSNLFRVGDPPGADPANTDPMFGGFITTYQLWDANNFYVFCDVVDNIIIDVPTNASWNQDAVELYFDGDNSKVPDGVSPDPGGGLAPGDWQFTIPHWMIGTEAGRLGAAFSTTLDTTGIEFKIKDRDVRGNSGMITEEGAGYNIEVKSPLAALTIDPTEGTLIGYEFQQDNSADATAGRQGMQKWWSNSNNSWTNANLWGTAVLGGPTAVKQTSPSVVKSYKLGQNYPNPFNPSTKITFELAKSEKVKLAVYNLLGEQVAVLVNGTRNAGPQTVTFDAKNLSSGVYFYKLEAGSTVLAKKMMLLK